MIWLCEPYFVARGHNVHYSTSIAALIRARHQDARFTVCYEPETRDEFQRVAGTIGATGRECRIGREGGLVRRLGLFALAVAQLASVRSRRDEDLILLAYEPWLTWLAMSFLRFRSVTLIDHSCDFPARPTATLRGMYKWINAAFVRRLARIRRVGFVVHSQFHARCMAEAIGARARVRTIEYGCTFDPVRRPDPEDRATPLVVVTGIWRKDKGIEFALRHFPRDLLERGYRLLVAGFPSEVSVAELEAIVAERELAGSVEFRPRYASDEELRQMHSSAAYVLLPYRADYVGGAGPLKDACGRGSAVVTSDAAGLGKLVDAAGIGLSFRADDPQSFEIAVRSMDEAVRGGRLDDFRQASESLGREVSWPRFVDWLLEAVGDGRAPPPRASASRAVKVVLDRTIAAVGLILTAPVLLVAALAVRATMGSPVLFVQERPGKGGRIFRLAKFRTMRAAMGPDGRPLRDEERITRLGKFLRATSIDELPQLFNVVRGDLSLVGPRPLLVQYLDRYTPEQARRHDVRPGITGWAQVNGRNAISWEERFRLDVWYVDHWSLALDAKILAMTFLKVLRQDGISREGHATMPEFKGSTREEAD